MKTSRASPPSWWTLTASTTSSGRASSSQTTSAAVVALPSAASSAARHRCIARRHGVPRFPLRVKLREQMAAWTGLSANGGRAPANDGCWAGRYGGARRTPLSGSVPNPSG